MTAKLSKKEKKPIQAKTSFTSPFVSQWIQIPPEDQNLILKTVLQKLIHIGLHKKEQKAFHSWRKNKKQSGQVPPPQVLDPGSGWSDPTARRELSVGINEVTKALEKNKLGLLLVCRSVKPSHMTNHLMVLSASRGVAACRVPGLSRTLAVPLGLRSVLALGFRRNSEIFRDAVDTVAARIPTPVSSWKQATGESGLPVDQHDEDGEKRGNKRKLQSGSSFSLQPLRVKKVVANPKKMKRSVK